MLNQFNAPLWGDEAFSAILSMRSLPDIIKIIINDTSPPLWNIAEWIVFNTLGTDEIYIRGLAFTFFLITVFFTYKIGRFLWSEKTGVVAAILTALNPFFFTFAFEGRMYSAMSAGAAGSIYFFARIMFDQKVQKKHILGYVVMTLWALYSHHFAMFVVMVQGLWFLKELITGNWKLVIPMLTAFLTVALGYLPWVWPLYHQTKMVEGGFWLGKPKLIDLAALILEYLAFGVKHLFAFPALVLIGATLGIRKWGQDLKKSLFIASWFLIPILATFAISQIFQSVFFNRYLLFTIPAAMIMAASNRRWFSTATIAIVILLFGIIDFYYFTHPTKLPFRDLAAYTKNTQIKGDYLINWNSTAHHLWETKYYGISAPIYIPNNVSLPYFVGTALMEKDDIAHEIPKNTKRVGVITSGDVEEIKLPGYTESDRKDFDRLKFLWYLKDGN